MRSIARNARRFGRLAPILCAWILAGCSAATLPSVHSEPERLALARRMVEHHQYSDAVELYKSYITNNAGSADVDHAVYWLGECYLITHDWAEAAVEFERLLREFPESDSSAAASFRLGEAWYGQSRPPEFDQEYTHKAIEQWRNYLENHPDHWLAEEARHRMQVARMKLATKLTQTGNLYVKLGDLAPAREYYLRIEREFSDLPQLGDAWLGLARIDAQQGHKPQAIDRLKQVEAKFAGRPVAALAAAERARLSR